MVYRMLMWLSVVALTSGCALPQPSRPRPAKSQLMKDIYAQSRGDAQKDVDKFIQENLKEQQRLGYIRPYIPVLQPPMVRKVWIPDHPSQEDPHVLVGGHWVYVMVQGPRWFTQDPRLK